MGGKRYNKDGSKKEPPKDAKPTKQPPSGQEASKSGGQQQSKPDKQSIEQKLQQVVVSEPVPYTSTSQPAEPPGQQGALSMGQGDQPAQPKVWSQQQPPPKQQGQSKAAAPGKGQGQGRGQPPSKGKGSDGLKPTKSDQKPGGSKIRAKKETPKYPPVAIPFIGKGSRGKPLGLIETNFLDLKILGNMPQSVYQYDVEIETKGPRKLYTKAFMQFLEENLPTENVVYDGRKIAFSSRLLKINGELVAEVSVIHPETHRTWDYTVKIQPADNNAIPIRELLTRPGVPHPRAQEAMQALEIIMKSAFHQHLDRGIQGGRSFFFRPENPIYLKDFCELRLGLFQSMVLGERPLLNVDVSHKAFPKRYNSLIDLLRHMERELSERRPFPIDLDRPLNENVCGRLVAHLSGLEICYRPNEANMRIQKFVSLGEVPAREMFTMRRGDVTERKSVQQYFNEINRVIRYPNLQCIRLGSRDNPSAVPMEFCSISDNQVINKKCTDNQTREMIRQSAGSTDQRKIKTMNVLNAVDHNGSNTIRAFGIEIIKKFIGVPARQLVPPLIEYANRKTAKVSKGAWRMEIGSEKLKYLVPSAVTKWCIINTDQYTRDDAVRAFAQAIFRFSLSTGLKLEPQPVEIANVKPFDLEKKLQQIGANKQIGIVFCVIPISGPMYAKIKQLAELKFGVLTQCVKANTIANKGTDPSTVSNILLKVNAKLNGTNHKLQKSAILSDFDKGKVMFIGADVTHPTPGQSAVPSVVGVTASYDRHAFRYNAGWRLQEGEIIEDFRSIVKTHLEYFKRENGDFPRKIIYYRDGVSDSQFGAVMAVEKTAIMQACHDVGCEKIVKLTILIVQKRHHARFFPDEKSRISVDRNNNVPPGTVVDTIIIRPNESHYYLCSHQSIQGVARPTKYCLLLDQSEHNIDDLTELTFNLCHLFTRCNRSVSYPAPTYYAHLVAARGKVYLEGQHVDMDDLGNEFKRRKVQDRIIRDHPMFFV